MHEARAVRLRLQIERQVEGVWAYINERRIDSPEKCSAIMTHRATMELLNQQALFVKEMNQGAKEWHASVT